MNITSGMKVLCLCAALGAFAIGCSGGSGGARKDSELSLVADESLNDIRVVNSNSPYAAAMTDCVRIIRPGDSCTLRKLPLIGQEFENPTIEDIMSRVVVSHDWMAERFRALLNELPSDIPTLLKATTAIVIDADVRPSHYRTRTGALYLDPVILWLSNEEKATINQKNDFRSDYGDDLLFRDAWRYVKDNGKAYKKFPLDGDETRELKDIVYLVAAVLYHESSHANDSFPASKRLGLNLDQSAYQAFLGNTESIARALGEQYPLKSDFLFDMAQIMMVGLLPGDIQKETSAEDMGVEFENDGANDIYNYVSPATSLSVAVLREDVAMLFEETMMKYHFNIDRDVAFLRENSFAEKCDDFILKWGVRNRIADSQVAPRAKLVASLVNPGVNLTGFFQALSTPKVLPDNVGWCITMDLSGAAMANSKQANQAKQAGLKVQGSEEPMESQLRPGL